LAERATLIEAARNLVYKSLSYKERRENRKREKEEGKVSHIAKNILERRSP
jgi:alkylation response protein AidB-like acyl-CoA dehydrogenase